MACYTAFREQDSDEVHIDLTEHFDIDRYEGEELIHMFHTGFVDRVIKQLKSNKIHAVQVHIDNTKLIPPAWTGILIHRLLDAEIGIVITNE